MDDRIAQIKDELETHGIRKDGISLYLVDAYAFQAGHEPLDPMPPNYVLSRTNFAQKHAAIQKEIDDAAYDPTGTNCRLKNARTKLYLLCHFKVVEPKAYYGTVGPLIVELMELLEKRAMGC